MLAVDPLLDHADGAARAVGLAEGRSGVSDVLLPQDVDYPSLQLDIDRVRASELGLNEKEVVGNVITALTSDAMIAPSYWVDPKSGNDYLLTVQYPENYIHNLAELRALAQDALEDAVLMGCDERQVREVLAGIIAGLVNPYTS